MRFLIDRTQCPSISAQRKYLGKFVLGLRKIKKIPYKSYMSRSCELINHRRRNTMTRLKNRVRSRNISGFNRDELRSAVLKKTTFFTLDIHLKKKLEKIEYFQLMGLFSKYKLVLLISPGKYIKYYVKQVPILLLIEFTSSRFLLIKF